jgi:sarcosine oxidase
MKAYDAIIIGLGGMGSAALDQLAGRGLSVLGLEQFEVGHDQGSSHGGTRLIRKSYFEHPDYVPLLVGAYRMWSELEADVKQTLFHRSGLLLAGPTDGPIISGVKRAARAHEIELEVLSVAETMRRYPGLQPSDEMEVLLEPEAGVLEVENCVLAQAKRAATRGAEIRTNCIVRSWSPDGSGVSVRTDTVNFRAEKLILCAGAWTGQLLTDLNLSLEVLRKLVFWFSVADDSYAMSSGCPVFGFDTMGGFLFGFPTFGERQVKVMEHSGGEAVADAGKVDRDLHAGEDARIREFLRRHLPRVSSELFKHEVCTYTMTKDEHFVVDVHPEYPQVLLACGFSGHGFKFAPVIGSVLADLATTGSTSQPVGFLGIRRER